jgi:hypothetical protein
VQAAVLLVFQTCESGLALLLPQSLASKLDVGRRRRQRHRKMVWAAAILQAKAVHLHIASHDGDNNNKNGTNAIIFHIALRNGNNNDNNNSNNAILFHIALCNGDNNNKSTKTTKCTSAGAMASNIDATTSQATSSIDTHKLQRQT